MKEQMERPALGDGVCGICQQPLSGQHWERWLPCGDAVHKSCALRQRRAESLCPCCRMDGKAQDGLVRVQSQDAALLLKNSEPADSGQRTHADAGGNGLSSPCSGMSEGMVASASIDACKDASPLSRLVLCPLCCIRLAHGDPQPCVFCILKPQLLKLVHVAEHLGVPHQENAVGRNLHAPCDNKGVTCQGECLVRSVRNFKSNDDDDGKACHDGSLLELFEPPCPDHERSKILNYKASTCVNPLQDISVWWSIERRVVKSNEERSEATRRVAIRRRVQRRARARRRRSSQATALGRRSADQEVGAEGTRGTGEEETTPESHDEESTTYGLPELEAEGDGNEGAENGADNAHSGLEENEQVSEEIVEEEDPEGGQQSEHHTIQQDEQGAEEDETDSDPDYTEPEGFASGAILDDEESIAPMTITRRMVDIEDSDYEEDSASDASDTTLDNGHNYDEQEDERLEMLRPEDTGGRTHVDQAGGGSHAFRNAGSSVNFWSNSHSLWSNLCARVRGCLPPCWRHSVQAVRNRLHQVTRPLEDIQAASQGHEEGFRDERNMNEEPMGTELDDLSTSPETRRVRRRMSR